VWSVLFAPETPSSEVAGIAAAVRAGGDRGELAEEHSLCVSRETGGELGWVFPGQVPAEVEAVLPSMAVGDIEVVSTSVGPRLVEVRQERWAGTVEQISPEELHHFLHDISDSSWREEYVQMLDVREPWELEKAALPLFESLPLSEFHIWGPQVGEMYDPEKATFLLCHHGIRSNQVAHFLVSRGFTKVMNVKGGIGAYAERMDPDVGSY